MKLIYWWQMLSYHASLVVFCWRRHHTSGRSRHGSSHWRHTHESTCLCNISSSSSRKWPPADRTRPRPPRVCRSSEYPPATCASSAKTPAPTNSSLKASSFISKNIYIRGDRGGKTFLHILLISICSIWVDRCGSLLIWFPVDMIIPTQSSTIHPTRSIHLLTPPHHMWLDLSWLQFMWTECTVIGRGHGKLGRFTAHNPVCGGCTLQMFTYVQMWHYFPSIKENRNYKASDKK